MSGFPPMPGWDSMHPLIIQFTVALLFVAPVLILASLFTKHEGRPWTHAGLLMMVLGTFAAWLAVGSGHAAATLIEKSRGLEPMIARHEAVGLLTRGIFTVLTVVFAAIVLLPALIKRPMPWAATVALRVVFVGLYAGCTMALANAAYEGTRLVHEYGVQAVVPAPHGPTAVETPAAEPKP